MPEALVPLSRLVGQPVVGPGGARLGQVADVVVRWDGAEPYPLVAGFVLDAGGQETFLPAAQAEVKKKKKKKLFKNLFYYNK
jgi:hypothetical protein